MKQAKDILTGDLFTYQGSFTVYRAVGDSEPDSAMPNRVVIKAVNERWEPMRKPISVRLRADCEVEVKNEPQGVVVKILRLQEKNGDRYFKGDTQGQIQRSSLKIVQERMERRWYSGDPDAEKQAREILDSDDGSRAFLFLKYRAHLDYEHIELVTLEE